ncbi:EpsG family protein [Clostridium estertheticum]|uniref:EpsG family protein n=1 Tax=Clostridium estertheticum TaxID=238834 RepID=UPI001C7CB2C3|nr:EpsG family protein [Clostridium estertheticum]MBX4264094.1 EpsG family protein [Clostridium estertheticum]WLC87197.1 EpsG family protein [Clostridium estertheticum]
MQYFIACVLIIICLLKKKSKIMFYILLLFTWLMFGWNTFNADYYTYEQTYYSIGLYNGYNAYFQSIEIGYRFINKIAYALGLDYSTFIIVFSAIGLLMIGNTILKYSQKPSYVLALYFIYPFLMDVVQIRNFMAMAIIIYGVRFLISSKKLDKVWFIIFVLLASSFHKTAIFYITLLFARVSNRNKLIKWVSCVMVFFWSLPLLMNIPFISSILGGIKYFSTDTSLVTKMGYFIYFGIDILLVRFSYKKIKCTDSEVSLNNIKEHTSFDIMNFTNIILNINIIMLCMYPLIFFSVEFIRIYRNLLPLNYILFSNVVTGLNNRVSMLIFKISAFIFVVLSGWLFTVYISGSSVFYPIFTNNNIFKLFGL